MSVDHPQFGRAFRCPDCGGHGTAERFAWHLRANSGIPPEVWDGQTFVAFDCVVRAPQMAAAFDAVRRWAETTDHPFLLLKGTVGTGKTHLAVAAAHTLVERRQSVTFTTVAQMLDDLRATQRPGSVDPLETVRGRLQSVAYLILDDLGADRATDFAQEQLFLVIDERWKRRRATLVTSNVALETLEDRVRSRLMDTRIGMTVACTGPDQRVAGGAS